MNAATSEVGARPYRIYDGDGIFVGDFAAWLPAHRWAHQRATEPGTRLPVEVEGRDRSYVEQVWPGYCQTLHAAEPAIMPTCPLAAVGERALLALPGGRNGRPVGDAARTADEGSASGSPGDRPRVAGTSGARVRRDRR